MRPGARLLLTLTFVAVFGAGVIRIAVNVQEVARDSDFAVLAAAGRTAASGHGGELYSPGAQRAALGALVPGRVKYFFNPPPVALAFVPFAGTPLVRAFCIWDALSIAVLVCAVGLLVREWGPADTAGRWLLASAILAFEPAYHNLRFGNVSAFVLLLAVMFLRDLARGRDARAGAWLATLLAIKPHLFLLPLAVIVGTRRWRAAASCAGGVAILGGASFVTVGVNGVVGYLLLSLEAARGFTEVQGRNDVVSMVNWRGLVAHVAGDGAAADAVVLAMTVAACILLWACWRRGAHLSRRVCALWALTMLATVLAAPHVYLQSLMLIVPATAWAIALSARDEGGTNAWRHLPAFALVVVGLSWWADVDHGLGLPALQLALTLSFVVLAGWLLAPVPKAHAECETSKRPGGVEAGHGGNG